jgi:hypothetical protein
MIGRLYGPGDGEAVEICRVSSNPHQLARQIAHASRSRFWRGCGAWIHVGVIDLQPTQAASER